MRDSTLFRVSGVSLVAGGAATALFWLLAPKIGTFVGADATEHPLWIPSQFLHVGGTLPKRVEASAGERGDFRARS